jgi:hypothetical protein
MRQVTGTKALQVQCVSWDQRATCSKPSPLVRGLEQSRAQCPALFRCGAPDGIRTHGPQIRNLMLYPAELRVHSPLD